MRLSACLAVKKLEVSHCKDITDSVAQRFAELPHLETLNLSFCNRNSKTHLTAVGMRYLAQAPRLYTLRMQNFFDVNDSMLEPLQHAKALTSLNLQGCVHILGPGLEFVAKMPALIELNLSTLINLRGDCLSFLTQAKHLRKLHLNRCQNLPQSALAAIGKLADLRVLSLQNMNSQWRDFSELTHLTHLQRLDLSHNSRLQDSDLYFLSQLKILQRLDIRGIKSLTERTLETEAKLFSLRKVSVTVYDQSKSTQDLFVKLDQRRPRLYLDLELAQ